MIHHDTCHRHWILKLFLFTRIRPERRPENESDVDFCEENELKNHCVYFPWSKWIVLFHDDWCLTTNLFEGRLIQAHQQVDIRQPNSPFRQEADISPRRQLAIHIRKKSKSHHAYQAHPYYEDTVRRRYEGFLLAGVLLEKNVVVVPPEVLECLPAVLFRGGGGGGFQERFI